MCLHDFTENGEKYLFWDIPRKNGTFYKQEGNDSIYATKGWGYGYFMSFKDIKDKGFLKGGDIFFLTSMQGQLLKADHTSILYGVIKK